MSHKTIIVTDGSTGFVDVTEALARGDEIMVVGGAGSGGIHIQSGEFTVVGGRGGRTPPTEPQQPASPG